MIDEMEENSIYHSIYWISHKAKRPFKSEHAAEILTASEGIEEGKTIAKAYSELLDIYIKFYIALESRYILKLVSTQKNSIEKSIHGDVSFIRY